MLDRLTQACADLGLIAVANRLDQQLTQRQSVELEFAEHIEHLTAERLARLFELFQQPVVHVALARFLGDQVPQMADLGLANPVDPAEALFQPVRVPGQVVVHHQMGALQVDALAGGVRGEQHLNLRVAEEALLRLASLLAAHGAVNQDH